MFFFCSINSSCDNTLSSNNSFIFLRSSKQLRLNWALFIGETWEDVGAREGDFKTSTIALAAPAKALDILSFFPLAGVGDPVIRGMFGGVS